MNIIVDTPKPLVFTLRKSRHPLSLTWASRRFPSRIFAIFFDHGCYFRNPCYGFSGQIPFIFTIASTSPLIGRFSTQKLETRPIISQSARLRKGFFPFPPASTLIGKYCNQTRDFIPPLPPNLMLSFLHSAFVLIAQNFAHH